MAVILDIQIPKTCGDCPFCIYTADEKRAIGYCNTSDEDYYCKALDRFMEYDKVEGGLDILGKPMDCPLKEVPSGKWIPIEYDGYADGNPVYDVWECSNCGYEHNGDSDTLTAYCPDCGCNMVDLG